MRYEHTAKVAFTGRFPIDMLRYDHAYPATESDSSRIELHEAHKEPTEIQVCAVTQTKVAPWTIGRWRSFGARIEHQTTQRL